MKTLVIISHWTERIVKTEYFGKDLQQTVLNAKKKKKKNNKKTQKTTHAKNNLF